MNEPDDGWSDRDRPADPDEMLASEDRSDGLWYPLGATDEGYQETLEVDEDGLITHTKTHRYYPPGPLRRPTERKPQ